MRDAAWEIVFEGPNSLGKQAVEIDSFDANRSDRFLGTALARACSKTLLSENLSLWKAKNWAGFRRDRLSEG